MIGLEDHEYASKVGAPRVSRRSRVLAWLKAKATSGLLKVLFGFRPPADGVGSAGELVYEMKRPPKAYMDILYIDEELRVTRGSKGSVVVTIR